MNAQVKRKPRFYSWREAILASNLSCTTKLVLLTLSCHMNDMGQSCFPSVRLLAKESSLSKQSVLTHLALARVEGWITVTEHGFGGQNWRRHEYVIGFPNEAQNSHTDEGGKRGVPPLYEKVVNVVDEGGQPSHLKVVNHVDRSRSVNKSINNSGKTQGAKKPRQRFVIPTVDQVQEYCQSRGNRVDPQLFHDHYEANGWVQGKGCKPIVSWQAAVRTWERNGISREAEQDDDPLAGCI